MAIYRNYYFKARFDESPLMSGRNLPNPAEDHIFHECDFHPCLHETLQELYGSCTFVDCNWKPKTIR